MKAYMEHQDFIHAYEIFRYGSNADPFAVLRLEDALTKDYSSQKAMNDKSSSHLVAYGMNKDNEVIPLRILGDLREGATRVSVLYNDDTLCQIGGRRNPITEGCLASRGGLIVEGYGALNYHYSVDSDNLFRN